MRQYMLSVPDEMLDAARVDGATEFGIFWRIVLPTTVPGLVSLAIIFFMSSWNNFLWPLTILHSESVQTVPVMLNSLQGPPGRTAFDVLMAGSVVSVLPMLLVFLLLQRRLVAGITSGAIKGCGGGIPRRRARRGLLPRVVAARQMAHRRPDDGRCRSHPGQGWRVRVVRAGA